MSDAVYELAFYGELAPGCSLEQTKQQIAQLFKTNVEQVERMFSGKRIVIRNKLDLVTGKKYVVAMAKRGAICQLEKTGQPGIAVDEAVEAQATASAAENSVPHSEQVEPAAVEGVSNVPAADQNPATTTSAEPAGETLIPGERLHVAGDKVDDILANAHLDVAPVGSRMSPEAAGTEPEVPDTSSMSLAPVGADLADKEEKPAPIVPDTSHLSLKE